MTTAVLAALFIVLPMPGAFEFVANVNDYVETHRRLAAGIEQPLCAEPEELERQTRALGAAIREARPRVGYGDVFTPAVDVFFRARIAELARPEDATPMHVLRNLPVLPAELEYRFAGAHLLLMDVGANIVVDVLWNVLPIAAPEGPAPRPHTFCDVHPEIASCWM